MTIAHNHHNHHRYHHHHHHLIISSSSSSHHRHHHRHHHRCHPVWLSPSLGYPKGEPGVMGCVLFESKTKKYPDLSIGYQHPSHRSDYYYYYYFSNYYYSHHHYQQCYLTQSHKISYRPDQRVLFQFPKRLFLSSVPIHFAFGWLDRGWTVICQLTPANIWGQNLWHHQHHHYYYYYYCYYYYYYYQPSHQKQMAAQETVLASGKCSAAITRGRYNDELVFPSAVKRLRLRRLFPHNLWTSMYAYYIVIK